jgi:hypothetical protein
VSAAARSSPCTAANCDCESFSDSGKVRPSGVGAGHRLCTCGHIDTAHGVGKTRHALKPVLVLALTAGIIVAMLAAAGIFDSGSSPGDSRETGATEFSYAESARAFRSFEKSVRSYFAGKSSLEDLRTKTAVASDVAASGVGNASGDCGDALSAYVAAIASYEQNLRSSVPTNGLASALGDGERFLVACKS